MKKLIGFLLVALVAGSMLSFLPNNARAITTGTILVSEKYTESQYSFNSPYFEAFKSLIITQGYSVIVSKSTITPDLLLGVDVLIVHMPTAQYSSSEIDEIEAFVSGSGGLFCIADHTTPWRVDNIIARWGFSQASGYVTDSNNHVGGQYHWVYYEAARGNFATHPITSGLTRVQSGTSNWFLSELPPGAVPIITTDTDGTASPSGVPIYAALDTGTGRIAISMDCNYFGPSSSVYTYIGLEIDDNAQFGLNTIAWLMAAEVGPPRLLRVSPDYGGNTGTVTVKIIGVGFSEGAVPRLVRNGYTDIVGEETTVVSMMLITTTFNLTGAEQGMWDVVVTLPDGTELNLEDAFTILLGGEPVIYIEITGRSQIRVGQTGTYYVSIYNKGTIDSSDLLVDLNVDEALKVMRVETMDGIMLWDRIAIENNITEAQTLFPELWEGAPEGIVEEFVDKTFLVVPNIAPESSAQFRVTVYAKVPWADDDPIVVSAVALGLLKFAAATFAAEFLSNLIAQSYYVYVDPVKEESTLHAIWKALQRSFTETVEDLKSLLTWTHEGVMSFTNWIVMAPHTFELFLVDYGVPWEKAIDITHKLADPLQKYAKILPWVKWGAWGVLTGIDVWYKHELAKAQYKPPETTAEKAVTPVWSWDPNAKAGPTGYGLEGFIPKDIELPYIIYFENLAEATAEAEDIVITDVLDTDLDWSTLSIGDTSHPDVMTWTFDPITGTITWIFNDINLPPNKIPPEGEGWVTFDIEPKPGLPSGTEIRNKATIVFDINPPMDTNEVLNTIDSLPPTSSVLPLPEESPTSFTVSWSGSDEGSGVKDYTVWFSEDGGPWVIWLPLTIETSATFTGELGHTYAFYSVAHDNVGNTEEPPETFDAVTTTTTDNTPPTTTMFVGSPHYVDSEGNIYVTSDTLFTLEAVDNNNGGSGVAQTGYSAYNSTYNTGWTTDVPPISFQISGLNDGTYYIDYNSTDNAGNVEVTNTETIILDNNPPSLAIETPSEGQALQDGVTLEALVTDPSGVDWLTFSIRQPDGSIIDQNFESMFADPVGDDIWQLPFNTYVPELPDGYYLLLVNASDMLGNEGHETVQFSIRNWACLELLPATIANKAGRTMPVKFSLRVFENVDPTKPFVYNEELTIVIYEEGDPDNPLQISTMGDTARDYRIDSIGELYITNFKTMKKPTTYVVEIYRKDWLIGSFEFSTVK